MPNTITDLSASELSAISDGDEIRLQRAAFEVGRRRHFSGQIDEEIQRLEMFISRPVNRASHPMMCASVERVIAAHKAAQGG
jgi:hypothetical protein